MVGLFAGSSGVATVSKTKPSRYHLWKGLVKGTVEGFCLIMGIRKEKK
jgi:hypothetical protein